MTATTRGTPNLIVAPTQNTAPVFEFRCLFTHDLRKKKKIWHDGSLRFHTFNRRVMVYDDSKNYIGDAHWREMGDFSEGEELRLDKGVMVEVGEQIGQTETDLAPVIIEKRHQGLDASPPRLPLPIEPRLHVSYVAGAILQARPKSLAAVLGTSQGPIGRARLPAQSPFQQRQNDARRQADILEERPAKKSRMSGGGGTDKNNRMQAPVSPVYAGATVKKKVASQHGPTSPALKSRTGDAANSSSTQSLYAVPQLGGRENTVQHETTQVSEMGESTSAREVRRPRAILQPLTPNTTSSRPKRRSNSNSNLQTLQAENRNQAKALPCKSSAATYTSRGEVVNRLRFADEKPRKKLMYRDVLQQIRHKKVMCAEKRTKIAHERDQGMEVQALSRMTSPKDILPQEASIANLFSEAEDDLPGVLERLGGEDVDVDVIPSPTAYSSLSAMAPASQLFVDQTRDPFNLTPSQQSSNGDFEPPPRSEILIVANDTRDGRANSPHLNQEDVSERVNILKDVLLESSVSVVTVKVPRSPSKQSDLGQQLPSMSNARKSPPRPGIHQAEIQQNSRRLLSEGDSRVHGQCRIDPTEGLQITAKATTTCAKQGPEKLQTPFRSPSKMQRCISDTTHIVQGGNLPQRRESIRVPAAVDAGFDPWSEPEAYMLFDWWPPGKIKPAFALNE